ncbi:efflux RND transporter permease subunit [Ferrimonas balearica]|uniref:efflux RND transporter permease subunit n=1 Tax=Ferrimonas balearica TaxID=44012 RepID=UPI001C99995F|nr:efflux RND transporter permease subunit [Ferrimonas balearica]MBY5920133.1 efflux RND transporter permease subunit [Ferrimonas balearica]MBY5997182.1 efflux RND transporter permease subunit [Ferrimonas balearica]
MNIAQYAIKHRVISWMFLVILAVGGVLAFQDLGRLEDPAFTIKDAMVITQYPGATAMEVEEELTYPLEKAIRQLPYVDKINSTSTPGMSQIMVSMKMDYGADELPQIWDELRRKVADEQPMLPPGAYPPKVIDDFGDVFGVLLMVTGDNYSYSELKSYVDYLRRELELVDGVGKVSLAGEQQEQIHIEISLKKLAALNLDVNTVVGLLHQQNAVLDAGKITIDGESLYLRPGGFNSSVDPIIHGRDTGQLVRLTDVATLHRGFQEIPTNLVQYNGQSAISLGISFATGVNVVEVGQRLDARLAELEAAQPAGIQLHTLYDQPKEVDQSVDGFIISLAEAVGIVILVLLFAMGWRSGLIIGLVLLLTVLGTFMMMQWTNVELHRISLGALIIALGMLVDNAIVVVEGILVGRQRGLSKVDAATAIVKQTAWPLLGATVIAITAFAPIGLSPDATGEFMGSLFWVLCYSLFLSWITALTLTPFLADLLLPAQTENEDNPQAETRDPYQGFIFTLFRGSLAFAMRHRALTLGAMLLLLVGAGAGFGFVKNAFFPPSNTPIFYLDLWMPEGTDIRATHKMVQDVEQTILAKPGVKFVTSTTGQGMQRFTLTYQPEKQYAAFAQLQIRTDTRERMQALMHTLASELPERYPQAQFQQRLMEIGPSPASKIEARLSGPDPDTLRGLAGEVEAIFRNDPGARNIRHNWRERTKVLVPVIDESQARRLGVSNEELAGTLQMAFGGSRVGLYRDGTRMLPIVVRLPEAERVDFGSFDNITIWSPTLQTYVPVQQVVSRVDLIWQDAVIQRKDRKRTLTVMADHDILGDETAASLFNRVRPQVEALPLPPGYSLEWGGEYEAQNDAQSMLFSSLPMGYLFMFIITVFLFDSLRKPVVIWLTVPLSVIGVTVGLLATNQPFTFTALLGLLSLSGMVLKNGIVLLDQLNLELGSGKPPYQAVMDAAVSRVRPVSMAALTTILGMIPLVFDAFFASMAVTIMFGLGFATVLTLVVVPVLYASFYRIRPPVPGEAPSPASAQPIAA